MTIAQVLKRLRLEHGLSQSELARKIHVSPSAIGMYEAGSRFPTREIEESIANYFGVSLDYLRGMDSEHEPTPYEIEFSNYSESIQKRLLAYAKFFIEQQKIDGDKPEDKK